MYNFIQIFWYTWVRYDSAYVAISRFVLLLGWWWWWFFLYPGGGGYWHICRLQKVINSKDLEEFGTDSFKWAIITLRSVAIDVKMLKLRTFFFSPCYYLILGFLSLFFKSSNSLPTPLYCHCLQKKKITRVIANTIKSKCHWTIIGYSGDFLSGFLTLKSERTCDGFPLRAHSIQSVIC